MRLGKISRSSLEAYLWIGNIILDNNLGLDLYIISTVYYMVVILDDEVSGYTN